MTSKRPQRTCLGCGKVDDQAALLRIALGENGDLEVKRLAKGRGGYLHKQATCWDLFLRKKSVYRAFHAEVARPAKERLVVSLRGRSHE
ncbi:MAG TPA: YlxR family protein [Candidatus Binatia bacterium]|jgi:hypothetical protein